MSNEFLVFVILDIEAGREQDALAGLCRNLESSFEGPFGPAAIWELRNSFEYAVELRLKDASLMRDLDELILDRLRTAPGVTETVVRPLYGFSFIDVEGGTRAFEAARSDSPESLGVVLCDVECGRDRAVHEQLLGLKPENGVVPVDVEMGFQSKEFDLAVLLVGTDSRAFHEYIKSHIRPIKGINDTTCEVWDIVKVFGKAEDFVTGWQDMAG